MSIKVTLFEFWKQKEIELGRTITVAEVTEATGVSRATIMRLRAGSTTRADWDVIGKLCRFFNIPPGPVPFVVWEED